MVISIVTRINIVDPSELMDQHLLAEYREIRLLCANLQRTLRSKCGFQERKVPAQFTLNRGHVYFFYNKGLYLHNRYEAIRVEMCKRGISAELEFPLDAWPDELYNDWKPFDRDRDIVRERIALRISQRPGWYRYYGKVINDKPST